MDSGEKAIKDAQRGYDRDIGKARAKRQKAFALADQKGYSLAQIARIVGLSESRIEQILKGD